MNATTQHFNHGLYGITPEWTDTDRLFEAIDAACRGGMRVLQWRQKSLSQSKALPLALEAKAICHHYDCQFFVNDSVALALACKADGVHIGRDDGSVSAIKKACAEAGHKLLIGVSCYNDIKLAQAAIDEGVDYVAFGALFPSSVKPDAVAASLDLFAAAKAYQHDQSINPNSVALVGIGGIDRSNAARVVSAGADSIAVISGLFEVEDIKATAQYLKQLF